MFIGTWRNELRSELKIERIDPDGLIHGTYATAVGDDDVIGKPEPVTGRTNGELISFIVDFDGTGSMTCWMGRYEHASDTVANVEEERIESQWILGRTVEGDEDDTVDMWASFLINGNRFVKVRSDP